MQRTAVNQSPSLVKDRMGSRLLMTPYCDLDEGQQELSMMGFLLCQFFLLLN
jgi:hypothetical protein